MSKKIILLLSLMVFLSVPVFADHTTVGWSGSDDGFPTHLHSIATRLGSTTTCNYYSTDKDVQNETNELFKYIGVFNAFTVGDTDRDFMKVLAVCQISGATPSAATTTVSVFRNIGCTDTGSEKWSITFSLNVLNTGEQWFYADVPKSHMGDYAGQFCINGETRVEIAGSGSTQSNSHRMVILPLANNTTALWSNPNIFQNQTLNFSIVNTRVDLIKHLRINILNSTNSSIKNVTHYPIGSTNTTQVQLINFSGSFNDYNLKLALTGWNGSNVGREQFINWFSYNSSTYDLASINNYTYGNTSTLSCAPNSTSGKIYCFGGYNGSRMRGIAEYDPLTNTFTNKSALLPFATNYLSCVEDTSTNRIYCLGGLRDSSVYNAQIYEYYSHNDTLFTKVATVPNSGMYDMGCSYDNRSQNIYCFGGVYDDIILGPNEDDIIFRYKPSTDTRTTLGATLPNARSGLSCTMTNIQNKTICTGAANPANQNDIVTFNTSNEQATSRQFTTQLSAWDSPCIYINKYQLVYCMGAFDSSELQRHVMVFNATENSSFFGYHKFPARINALGCAYTNATDKIYCFGGSASSDRYNSVFSIDPQLERTVLVKNEFNISSSLACSGLTGGYKKYRVGETITKQGNVLDSRNLGFNVTKGVISNLLYMKSTIQFTNNIWDIPGSGTWDKSTTIPAGISYGEYNITYKVNNSHHDFTSESANCTYQSAFEVFQPGNHDPFKASIPQFIYENQTFTITALATYINGTPFPNIVNMKANVTLPNGSVFNYTVSEHPFAKGNYYNNTVKAYLPGPYMVLLNYFDVADNVEYTHLVPFYAQSPGFNQTDRETLESIKTNITIGIGEAQRNLTIGLGNTQNNITISLGNMQQNITAQMGIFNQSYYQQSVGIQTNITIGLGNTQNNLTIGLGNTQINVTSQMGILNASVHSDATWTQTNLTIYLGQLNASNFDHVLRNRINTTIELGNVKINLTGQMGIFNDSTFLGFNGTSYQINLSKENTTIGLGLLQINISAQMGIFNLSQFENAVGTRTNLTIGLGSTQNNLTITLGGFQQNTTAQMGIFNQSTFLGLNGTSYQINLSKENMTIGLGITQNNLTIGLGSTQQNITAQMGILNASVHSDATWTQTNLTIYLGQLNASSFDHTLRNRINTTIELGNLKINVTGQMGIFNDSVFLGFNGTNYNFNLTKENVTIGLGILQINISAQMGIFNLSMFENAVATRTNITIGLGSTQNNLTITLGGLQQNTTAQMGIFNQSTFLGFNGTYYNFNLTKENMTIGLGLTQNNITISFGSLQQNVTSQMGILNASVHSDATWTQTNLTVYLGQINASTFDHTLRSRINQTIELGNVKINLTGQMGIFNDSLFLGFNGTNYNFNLTKENITIGIGIFQINVSAQMGIFNQSTFEGFQSTKLNLTIGLGNTQRNVTAQLGLVNASIIDQTTTNITIGLGSFQNNVTIQLGTINQSIIMNLTNTGNNIMINLTTEGGTRASEVRNNVTIEADLIKKNTTAESLIIQNLIRSLTNYSAIDIWNTSINTTNLSINSAGYYLIQISNNQSSYFQTWNVTLAQIPTNFTTIINNIGSTNETLHAKGDRIGLNLTSANETIHAKLNGLNSSSAVANCLRDGSCNGWWIKEYVQDVGVMTIETIDSTSTTYQGRLYTFDARGNWLNLAKEDIRISVSNQDGFTLYDNMQTNLGDRCSIIKVNTGIMNIRCNFADLPSNNEIYYVHAVTGNISLTYALGFEEFSVVKKEEVKVKEEEPSLGTTFSIATGRFVDTLNSPVGISVTPPKTLQTETKISYADGRTTSIPNKWEPKLYWLLIIASGLIFVVYKTTKGRVTKINY